MLKISFYIVLICLYYLIAIYIYIGYKHINGKRINNRVNKVDNKLGVLLSSEFNNYKIYKDFDSCILKQIQRRSKKNINRKYIYKFLVENLKKNRNITIEFVRETNILKNILNSYSEKEYDVAYKIKCIGEFKIDGYYDYIIERCNDNSIYLQITSLKALSKLGNIEYFISGLINIVSSGSIVHEKVLIDNIISFEGNRNDLNERLEKHLLNDSNEILKIILNYFKIIKYHKALMIVLRLLEKENLDKEIKITCIKYIIDIKSNNIRNKLILLLKDQEWEVRALVVVALGNYFKDKEVIEALKELLKDKNWYVRQNSAVSLYKLINDKKEMLNIIYGDDIYASDAILSFLSEREDLDKYIFDDSIDLNLSIKELSS